MNIEDLKDQVLSSIEQYKVTIKESSLYNTLLERFQTLSSTMQSIVIFGTVAFALFFILSIPFSYLSSSNDSESHYDQSVQTIRDLLKTTTNTIDPNSMPTEILMGQIQNSARQIIDQSGILKDQKGGITPLSPNEHLKTTLPKSIKKAGVQITLNKLNITEVIKFAKQFQEINPQSLKLIDMSVRTAGNSYFNVSYKLVNYFLPQQPSEPVKKNGRRSKGK